MHILALNAGSSSLKFRLIRMGEPAETDLAGGTVEHVGGDTTSQAAEEAVRRCLPLKIDAVGFRVVHGGARFVEPARLGAEVLEGIRAVSTLAPLHNRIDLAVIEAALRLLPGVPGVAVFDTAFHATLPEVAFSYALPRDLCARWGLRRYGFHGISHRYVSEQLLACLGRGPEGTRVIICHLGNGASVCAVRDGRSIDTSMGLTPLEGLVMGTRCGDLDPGLILHLQNAAGMTAAQVDELLNRKSGLLGLSGRSKDVRELEQATAAGNVNAELALAVFAYRVRKYLGAYAAALGGLDAVAFTGGIGEHSASVRRQSCAGLEFLGVRLDEDRNRGAGGPGPQKISAAAGPVGVWVIPTDEERQIAREVHTLLHTPST